MEATGRTTTCFLLLIFCLSSCPPAGQARGTNSNWIYRLVRTTTTTTTTTTTEAPTTGSSVDNDNSTGRPYYGEVFDAVYEAYSPIHGYLSLVVCVFGVFSNIMTVVVLTRREMWSPTNAILVGIAMANLMVNLDYIPFTIHTSIANSTLYTSYSTYAWAVLTLLHAHVSVTFHSISSWLIVLLAVWRYIAVSFPLHAKSWCTMRNARHLILGTYVLSPIICLPLYLSFSVQEDLVPHEKLGNITIHLVSFSELSLKDGQILKNVNFWVYSVGLKVVPCILLTYLSIALIRVVLKAEKRRQRLRKPMSASCMTVSSNDVPAFPMNNRDSTGRKSAVVSPLVKTTEFYTRTENHLLSIPQSNNTTPSGSNLSLARKVSVKNQIRVVSNASPSDRTTKMLLAILLFFLMSELPNGLVYLLIGILGDEFTDSVYQPLGDVFDELALINASINFILLATMSRVFRKTFCGIFFPKKFRARLRSSAKRLTMSSSKKEDENANQTPILIGKTGPNSKRPPVIQEQISAVAL